MRSIAASVGRVTRLSIIATAIAIASLSGMSANVLTTSGSPALEGAHRDGTRDRPKGTLWVVNRDLGQLAIFDAGTGTLLRTLPVGAGAHDICISEAGPQGVHHCRSGQRGDSRRYGDARH
jgi:hypothetical protein